MKPIHIAVSPVTLLKELQMMFVAEAEKSTNKETKQNYHECAENISKTRGILLSMRNIKKA